MKLMTKEIEKKLPPLYSGEGTPLEEREPVVKYFTPWSNWTWYVLEGQKQEDGDWLFFGLVEGLETELGYFRLSDLQSIRGPVGLRVERDLYFIPEPITSYMKIAS